MPSINQIVNIIDSIQGLQSGENRNNINSKYRLVSRQILLIIAICSFIIDIFINIFMAYTFPLLFVSWVIISDPFYRKKIINLYKK